MEFRKYGCILLGVSIAAIAAGGRAIAANAEVGPAGSLDEIVITATRQTDTIHDVPLTVTAISSEQLDRQGVREAEDLIQTVTSLRISGANAGGAGGVGGSSGVNAQISVRGIASSVSGAAPTTGIYIDDVPLQQRTSLAPTGGGTPLPLLFDLERVEVLKGPQGTLYGGSSEGGTLRFITKQPSLSEYSLYTQAEGNSTEHGDGGYEYGISAGGPIVDDLLAAHVSGLIRHDGGYIDHVSQFTGNTLASNTNGSDHIGFHGVVLLKITDRASATVGLTYQREHYADTDNYWFNIPQYQANVGPVAAPTTYTYGPYNMFGPYKSGTNTNIGQNFYTSDSQLSPEYQPHTQQLTLPSLTLDYRFDAFTVKSVTAYSETKNRNDFPVGFSDLTGQGKNIFTPPVNQTVEGPFNALPGNSPFIANLPVYDATFHTTGKNETLSEELRFASAGNDTRLNWVGGLFFDRSTMPGDGYIEANINDVIAAVIHGTSQHTPDTVSLDLPSTLYEKQYAAYGEAVYKIFDSLNATAGVRYTRDKFSFSDEVGGALFGFMPGELVPSATGSLDSSATTPKAGLQYVLDRNTNFYVTIAEGFRPGGVNPSLPPNCLGAAAAAGYTTVPKTFSTDKLWSYEGGVKLKTWEGRATMNAAAFYIDWKDAQTNIDLGCGTIFAENATKEISRGIDFEGSVLLLPGLTATLRAGYTDAYFPDTLKTPAGTSTLINSGDRVLYTPKTQADLGVEYQFNLLEQKTFVRADYSYQSSVSTSYGPGTVSYVPENRSLPGADILNMRAGMYFGKLQLSVYALNVTNSEDLLFRNGFSVGPGPYGCQNAACTSYNKVEEGGIESTYRPRTIGIAAAYRY